MALNNTADEYSAEEVSALSAVFSLFDEDGVGRISVQHLEAIFTKLGRPPHEADDLLKSIDLSQDDETITFEEFLLLVRKQPDIDSPYNVGPDPKVMEFINILEEYRAKCEEDGNYLEAQRADTQLVALRTQEAKRQSKSLKAKQIAERQDIQIAHNMQYTDFNMAWDQYMEEYDNMAQAYIRQMTDKHNVDLRSFQEKLHKELMERPPKFSKELIEWRRRQHRLAQQKNYAEAQKIKLIADDLEAAERANVNENLQVIFTRKETKFRQQQQAEIQALLKRIDGRRKEHIKQRNLDSKRLLQRNRNVQAVLESKQSVEATKKLQDIRAGLNPRDRIVSKHPQSVIPPEARVIKPKKPAPRDANSTTFITNNE
ncbi:hypothetical protein SPRG_05369 [Saprolegnia parasitica CBS 223.65]|uniref:EF-hand domain-containing protein n=1 Tax=Saprolegnia parasitica (strain CBS 223.65) TaxID=695850 RepID=A0A067CTU6_SAPPC|nr:hypothetical protein SPRG_05369 [Saprolegnia parasitica CBS 223.65]KDO30177.1 hypothetical protein SPRG_05369 [Saprolegnia parasitica CBS 223.65]|eukprot:XP_012199355.1 hypothetical protein SPRG_05369 [Saprolegnia parasitica CBS 223.65]